ncbi:MAG: cation:proton antiporter, partial [Frankiaceae bacterium]|nr:cation:proton antiporter [Frankiaceae bacterium]
MTLEATLLLILAAVGVIVAVHGVEERTGLPSAALLTIVGIVYAVLPGPNAHLNPDFILAFVLPPLLYSAALDSSLLAIRRSLRIVVSLSVVLVILTALIVGMGFGLFVAGATFAAGTALGAAVAPPDPVAALAVGRRVGLPAKLVTVIQGEGLLNDATALTLLTVAVSAARGNGFSTASAAGHFVYAAAGGIAAGVVSAVLVRMIQPLTTEPLSANAISLATPFVAYLLGEKAHASGVLAVVVAGLVIGHGSPRSSSGAGRLQTGAVWRLVDFLLEGFVFLLIGQQLPSVLSGLSHYHFTTIAAAIAVTLVAVLVLRPAWLILTQALPRSLHTRLGRGDDDDDGAVDPEMPPEPGPDRADIAERAERRRARERRRLRRRRTRDQLSRREIVALSWSGTRGVITLAAIFTLPLTGQGNTPFPDRDLLLFCAYLTVFVTLVGQGLTFAPLVRRLGVRANSADQARLRNEARVASVHAALVRLEEEAAHPDQDLDEHAIEVLRDQLNSRLRRYHGRIELLSGVEAGELPVSPQYEAALRLRHAVIEAQREELLF